MRKWTTDEERQIIKAAKASPDHLRKAFGELSKEIGRSPEAIVTRYYNVLLPKGMVQIEPKYKNETK